MGPFKTQCLFPCLVLLKCLFGNEIDNLFRHDYCSWFVVVTLVPHRVLLSTRSINNVIFISRVVLLGSYELFMEELD